MTQATVATPKTAYSTEQTAELVALYNAGKGATIEQLAAKFGKNAKSIISKLAREKVYVKPAGYTTKTGEPVVKKDAAADSIGKMLQLDVNDTDSLTKANKGALTKISHALAHSVPLETLTPIEEKTRDTMGDAIGFTFDMAENDRLSLRRLPIKSLEALYIGLMAFDFVSDTRITIEKLTEDEQVDTVAENKAA
jgi:hypothetical protein